MRDLASRALTELLAQHEALRAMMDGCEQLANELDDRGGSPDPLMHEVARLRLAFDRHNHTEEHVLRPLLRETHAFGEVRIGHMVTDHISEHRAMSARFASGLTGELRATIATLRAHLAAEEMHFSNAPAVRDDVSVDDGRG